MPLSFFSFTRQALAKGTKVIDEDGLFALIAATQHLAPGGGAAPAAAPRPAAAAAAAPRGPGPIAAGAFHSAGRGAAAPAGTAAGAAADTAAQPGGGGLAGGAVQDLLWVDKYKPKHGGELVGNNQLIRDMRTWLDAWEKVRCGRAAACAARAALAAAWPSRVTTATQPGERPSPRGRSAQCTPPTTRPGVQTTCAPPALRLTSLAPAHPPHLSLPPQPTPPSPSLPPLSHPLPPLSRPAFPALTSPCQVHRQGQAAPSAKGGSANKVRDLSKKAVLLSGPPGIGKTSAAHIIAREAG